MRPMRVLIGVDDDSGSFVVAFDFSLANNTVVGGPDVWTIDFDDGSGSNKLRLAGSVRAAPFGNGFLLLYDTNNEGKTTYLWLRKTRVSAVALDFDPPSARDAAS